MNILSWWLPPLFLMINMVLSLSLPITSLNAFRQLTCLSFNCLSSSLNIPHHTQVCLISKPFISSVAFLWTHSSVSFQTYDIQNKNTTQGGQDGATQSCESDFFLFAFHLKPSRIKVFAFIGNRFLLIPLSLLPTICNTRAFGTIKLPLVLMWTDDSFTGLFHLWFQAIFPM